MGQICLPIPPPPACPFFFLISADLKRLSSWPSLLSSNSSSVLLALFCLDSALCLLYLLPNNFCAQKHQVQFFSPCHQTKPLSCPLLPAVISVTHLLNPQASFIPRQMSLLVLSWNVFYGFCECFCLYIFHDGFDFFGVLFPLLVYSRKQGYCNVLTIVFISIVKVFAASYWYEIEICNASKSNKTLLDHTFNDSYSLQVHVALAKMTTLWQTGWFLLCHVVNLKTTSSKNGVLQGTFQMLYNNLHPLSYAWLSIEGKINQQPWGCELNMSFY